MSREAERFLPLLRPIPTITTCICGFMAADPVSGQSTWCPRGNLGVGAIRIAAACAQ